MVKSIVATFLIAFVLLYIGIELATALGELAPLGATFDLRSGTVMEVTSGSAAALAGVRAGDRVDFARGGWQLHLSTNRLYLYSGRSLVLPLIRDGKPITATLVGPPPVPPPDAWSFYANIAFAMLYSGLGAALFFLRRNTASLVFFAFACAHAIDIDNLAPLHIATPAWMPLAMFAASLGPGLSVYGLLYFSFLFANPSPSVDHARRYVLIPAVVVQVALYYYHFYGFTIFQEPFNSYLVYSILQWLIYAAAAVVITARVNREANSARLRWVAVGIWLQAIVFAMFFIDENVTAPSSQGTAFINYLFAWFQPGTLCIAYVLMRTRVIDARVVGARTLVYGLLTAIPIGLFSIADWFFSRRLADARLATFAEFGIAVCFGVWLNTLHKRIDRFVERIVFSERHHAFTRIRNAIHALPSAERSSTVFSMLVQESGHALNLASAALFIERAGIFERVAAYEWDGCAETLDFDDPMALFARSHGRLVHLSEVAPPETRVPAGDARPEVAIPVTVDHHVFGIALYGRHSTGEHLDSSEEDLLCDLAHTAGSALGRLHSADRIKELEAQNALLLSAAR